MENLQLDLEAVGRQARAASSAFSDLAAHVKILGQTSPRNLAASIKSAQDALRQATSHTDRLNAALKNAGGAGRDVFSGVRQLNSELDVSRRKALSFRDAFHGIGEKLSPVLGGLKHYGGMALGAAAKAAHLAVDQGKDLIERVVELASEKEATIKGLGFIYSKGAAEGTPEARRGEGQAKELYSGLLELAKRTPLADKELAGFGKRFATVGYGPKQALFLARALADQQSKFMENPRIAANFASAVERGTGRYRASVADINSLRSAGFNAKAIMENLPSQKGMPEIMKSFKGGKFALKEGDTELSAMSKLQSIISGKQVRFTTLLNAAMASIAPQGSLDKIGSLAEMKAQTTLLGAINRAKNSFDNLVLGLNFENSPGLDSLKGFLNMFSKTLGESGRLKGALTGMLDSMLKPLSEIKPEHMEKMLGVLAQLGEAVGRAFRSAGEALGQILNAKDPIAKLKEQMASGLGSLIREAGSMFAAGMLEAIRQGVKNFHAKDLALTLPGIAATGAKDLAGSAWESARALVAGPRPLMLGAGSGSDEFMESRGMGGGPPKLEVQSTGAQVFDEGGVVRGPQDQPQLVIARGGERFHGVNGRGGAGGSGATLNINGPLLVVQGNVSDVDALGAAIRPMILEEFTTVMRRLAMEG